MISIKKLLVTVVAVVSMQSMVMAEQLDDVIKKIQVSDKDGVEELLQAKTFTAVEYEKLIRAADKVVAEGEDWSTLNMARLIGGGVVTTIGTIGSLYRTFTKKHTDPFFDGPDFFFLMVMCIGCADGYMAYRSYNKHVHAKAIVKCLREAQQDARGTNAATV